MRTVLLRPGLERLRSQLRPGQLLQAKVLRSLEEGKCLLRLLGKNVVATSRIPLQPKEEVPVRVRSVTERIHLQLLQPPAQEVESADARREDRRAHAVAQTVIVQLPDREQPIRVMTVTTGEKERPATWSVEIEVEDSPRTRLRFALQANTSFLSIQLMSECPDLVKVFVDEKYNLSQIIEYFGFVDAGIGARHLYAADGSGALEQYAASGVDLVI